MVCLEINNYEKYDVDVLRRAIDIIEIDMLDRNLSENLSQRDDSDD